MNYRFPYLSILMILMSFPIFSQNPLNFGSNIRTADSSAHVWQDGRLFQRGWHDPAGAKDREGPGRKAVEILEKVDFFIKK